VRLNRYLTSLVHLNRYLKMRVLWIWTGTLDTSLVHLNRYLKIQVQCVTATLPCPVRRKTFTCIFLKLASYTTENTAHLLPRPFCLHKPPQTQVQISWVTQVRERPRCLQQRHSQLSPVLRNSRQLASSRNTPYAWHVVVTETNDMTPYSLTFRRVLPGPPSLLNVKTCSAAVLARI
jgi:hypothetical protein